MTDLIKRLRKADEYEPLGHGGWEAADRIEELVKERDYTEGTNDTLIALNQALEAKLAKAVEVLRFYAHGHSTPPTWHRAHKVLAELEK